MTTTTESSDRERYEATLRAEQSFLIADSERLSAQLQANERRLKEIWKALIVKPIAKREQEEV